MFLGNVNFKPSSLQRWRQIINYFNVGNVRVFLQSHIMAGKAVASTLKTSLGPNGEY